MRRRIIGLGLLVCACLMGGCGHKGTDGGVGSVMSTESKTTEVSSETETGSESETTTEEASETTEFSMGSVDEKIKKINEIIDKDFLFSEDANDREEGVYKGILESLDDPYSVYYTKEEFDELQQTTSGEYQGIGVQVSQNRETKIITVTKVFKGSPAEAAGVLREDEIAGVDDFEFGGEDIGDVVKKIRGPEGTSISLKVYRPSINDYVTMTVERRKIENPTVEAEMLEGGIGLIKVTEFDTVTLTQYIEALESLNSQGMKSLIVDLRDNPGGTLSTVVGMLDYMLPEGMLVYTVDRDGNRTSEMKSTDSHSFDKPVAVLVNGNSASASEIFAGAMKDRGAATIIGTTTFGKGIVQRLIPLDDGSGIKLTVSKYYTPSGNEIHKVGISPNIEIDLPDELKIKSYLEPSEDVQLQKAIETLKK
ncbi:MAG: S41 family peptidase [Lachnospiraceae bacterium]|nr:S41 family peptidase [Lachnospiraceae bacterium]